MGDKLDSLLRRLSGEEGSLDVPTTATELGALDDSELGQLRDRLYGAKDRSSGIEDRRAPVASPALRPPPFEPRTSRPALPADVDARLADVRAVPGLPVEPPDETLSEEVVAATRPLRPDPLGHDPTHVNGPLLSELQKRRDAVMSFAESAARRDAVQGGKPSLTAAGPADVQHAQAGQQPWYRRALGRLWTGGVVNPLSGPRRLAADMAWHAQRAGIKQELVDREVALRLRGGAFVPSNAKDPGQEIREQVWSDVENGVPLLDDRAHELQKEYYVHLRSVAPEELPPAENALDKGIDFAGGLPAFLTAMAVLRKPVEALLPKGPPTAMRAALGEGMTAAAAGFLEEPSQSAEDVAATGLFMGGLPLTKGAGRALAGQAGGLAAEGLYFGAHAAPHGDLADVVIQGVAGPLIFNAREIARFPFRRYVDNARWGARQFSSDDDGDFYTAQGRKVAGPVADLLKRHDRLAQEKVASPSPETDAAIERTLGALDGIGQELRRNPSAFSADQVALFNQWQGYDAAMEAMRATMPGGGGREIGFDPSAEAPEDLRIAGPRPTAREQAMSQAIGRGDPRVLLSPEGAAAWARTNPAAAGAIVGEYQATGQPPTRRLGDIVPGASRWDSQQRADFANLLEQAVPEASVRSPETRTAPREPRREVADASKPRVRDRAHELDLAAILRDRGSVAFQELREAGEAIRAKETEQARAKARRGEPVQEVDFVQPQDLPKHAHRLVVREALRRGEAIPKRIADVYPDLRIPEHRTYERPATEEDVLTGVRVRLGERLPGGMHRLAVVDEAGNVLAESRGPNTPEGFEAALNTYLSGVLQPVPAPAPRRKPLEKPTPPADWKRSRTLKVETTAPQPARSAAEVSRRGAESTGAEGRGPGRAKPGEIIPPETPGKAPEAGPEWTIREDAGGKWSVVHATTGEVAAAELPRKSIAEMVARERNVEARPGGEAPSSKIEVRSGEGSPSAPGTSNFEPGTAAPAAPAIRWGKGRNYLGPIGAEERASLLGRIRPVGFLARPEGGAVTVYYDRAEQRLVRHDGTNLHDVGRSPELGRMTWLEGDEVAATIRSRYEKARPVQTLGSILEGIKLRPEAVAEENAETRKRKNAEMAGGGAEAAGIVEDAPAASGAELERLRAVAAEARGESVAAGTGEAEARPPIVQLGRPGSVDPTVRAYLERAQGSEGGAAAAERPAAAETGAAGLLLTGAQQIKTKKFNKNGIKRYGVKPGGPVDSEAYPALHERAKRLGGHWHRETGQWIFTKPEAAKAFAKQGLPAASAKPPGTEAVSTTEGESDRPTGETIAAADAPKGAVPETKGAVPETPAGSEMPGHTSLPRNLTPEEKAFLRAHPEKRTGGLGGMINLPALGKKVSARVYDRVVDFLENRTGDKAQAVLRWLWGDNYQIPEDVFRQMQRVAGRKHLADMDLQKAVDLFTREVNRRVEKGDIPPAPDLGSQKPSPAWEEVPDRWMSPRFVKKAFAAYLGGKLKAARVPEIVRPVFDRMAKEWSDRTVADAPEKHFYDAYRQQLRQEVEPDAVLRTKPEAWEPRELIHKQLIDVLRGTASKESLQPGAKAVYGAYKRIIDGLNAELSGMIDARPELRESIEAWGLENIVEMMRLPKVGDQVYLRQLYNQHVRMEEALRRREGWAGAAGLLAWKSATDAPRVRGGMFKAKRSGAETQRLWTLTKADGTTKQFTDFDDGAAEYMGEVEANAKKYGEQVWEKVRFEDPFGNWVGGMLEPVRDARYLMARTASELAHNVESLKFFLLLRDSGAAIDPKVKPDVKVDPLYAEIPDHPAYGPVRGMYIPKGVQAALDSRELAYNHTISEWYGAFSSLWAGSRTVTESGTWVRNVLGNIAFGTMDGMTPRDIPYYARAATEISKRGPHFRRLVADNVLSRGFFQELAREFERELKRDDLPVSTSGAMMRAGDAFFRKYGTAVKTLGKGYDFADQVMKVASYLKKLDKGYTPEDAIEAVDRAYPNYSRMGGAAKLLRIYPVIGNRFAAFPDQAAKIYARTLREHPGRALGVLAAPYLLSVFSRAYLGIDDEEMELIQKDRRRQMGIFGEGAARWIADKTVGVTPGGYLDMAFHGWFEPLLPFRDKSGAPMRMNLEYIIPMASELRMTSQQGGVALPLILQEPLGRTLIEIMNNRNAWQQRIAEDDASPVEAWGSMLGHALDALAPVPGLAGRWKGRELYRRLMDRADDPEAFRAAVLKYVFGLDIGPTRISRGDALKLATEKLSEEQADAAGRILELYEQNYRGEDDKPATWADVYRRKRGAERKARREAEKEETED